MPDTCSCERAGLVVGRSSLVSPRSSAHVGVGAPAGFSSARYWEQARAAPLVGAAELRSLTVVAQDWPMHHRVVSAPAVHFAEQLDFYRMGEGRKVARGGSRCKRNTADVEG